MLLRKLGKFVGLRFRGTSAKTCMCRYPKAVRSMIVG